MSFHGKDGSFHGSFHEKFHGMEAWKLPWKLLPPNFVVEASTEATSAEVSVKPSTETAHPFHGSFHELPWKLAATEVTSTEASVKSRSTVAPSQLLFDEIAGFKTRSRSYLSPEIRCPSTIRRHRSTDICTQENRWIICFNRILPCVEQP